MCLWTYGKMQQRSVYIPYISYEISVTAASSHLLVIVTFKDLWEIATEEHVSDMKHQWQWCPFTSVTGVAGGLFLRLTRGMTELRWRGTSTSTPNPTRSSISSMPLDTLGWRWLLISCVSSLPPCFPVQLTAAPVVFDAFFLVLSLTPSPVLDAFFFFLLSSAPTYLFLTPRLSVTPSFSFLYPLRLLLQSLTPSSSILDAFFLSSSDAPIILDAFFFLSFSSWVC